MTESTKPISALRQRMIEDMRMRKLSPCGTQRGYVRAVKRLPDISLADHRIWRMPRISGRFSCIWPKTGVSSTTH